MGEGGGGGDYVPLFMTIKEEKEELNSHLNTLFLYQCTAGGRSGRSLVARSVPRRAERATRPSPKPAPVPTRPRQVLAPDRVQATATGPVLPTATPRRVPVSATCAAVRRFYPQQHSLFSHSHETLF